MIPTMERKLKRRRNKALVKNKLLNNRFAAAAAHIPVMPDEALREVWERSVGCIKLDDRALLFHAQFFLFFARRK